MLEAEYDGVEIASRIDQRLVFELLADAAKGVL